MGGEGRKWKRDGEPGPALEGIHQLARSLEAAAHEDRLLADHGQSILQQPRLVLYWRGLHGCDGGSVAHA